MERADVALPLRPELHCGDNLWSDMGYPEIFTNKINKFTKNLKTLVQSERADPFMVWSNVSATN